MPEYLTPGVYLEETSFRSRSIEGVPTSTFGMAGLTCYGPVAYQLATPQVTMIPKPMLVTSYTEFERAFGSLDDVGTGTDTRNYLGLCGTGILRQRRPPAVRVAGVPVHHRRPNGIDLDANFAKLALDNGVATWRARWPGAAGHTISVTVGFQRSKNILVTANGNSTLKGVSPGAAVEIVPDRTNIPKDNVPPANIRIVDAGPNRVLGYRKDGGGLDPVTDDGQQARLPHHAVGHGADGRRPAGLLHRAGTGRQEQPVDLPGHAFRRNPPTSSA